jgi:type II secretory pathway pseudopilin PulG
MSILRAVSRRPGSAPPTAPDSPVAAKDQGVALIAVMVAMAMISAFLLVSLNYALQSSKAGRSDQDAKIAAAAASAGLDEYVSRLNATPGYYLTVDPLNLAFSTGRTIQGTGTSGASYKYALLSNSTETSKTGIVRLRVTGTSRTVSRTITANLRTKGFLSYIYLSNYEVQDPELGGTPPGCAQYYYAGRSGVSGCAEIQWTGGDTVNGALHSNDQLQINGPVKFKSTAETSWPAASTATGTTRTWWGTETYAGLSTNGGGNLPKYAVNQPMPNGNVQLSTHTTPGADGAQTGPGCYYTGATRITFTGATMTVQSPATKSTATPAACLDVALNISSGGAPQTGLAIPPVIYVNATTNACTLGAIGYPAVGEAVTTTGGADALYWTSTSGNKTTNYRCGRGTAYVSGSVADQVTIASADDIVVTGNLTVADNRTGTDVIGLIAGKEVWVYNPITSTTANLLPLSSAVTSIDAAILSVSRSFVVQNWADGNARGTLNVNGAIAQNFRGPVGTGSGTTISTGYYKNYVYDPRLAYLQPPYFLTSTSNQWLVSGITDK